MKVSSTYSDYPDPTKPGHFVTAQEANLTIEANTACELFEACKRVPLVTSVSAMSNPAGFLNFQGMNALNNAKQHITVFITYNKSEGIYFNNDTELNATLSPTPCNYQGDELHGFKITEGCTCNTCELSCNPNEGFQYF